MDRQHFRPWSGTFCPSDRTKEILVDLIFYPTGHKCSFFPF